MIRYEVKKDQIQLSQKSQDYNKKISGKGFEHQLHMHNYRSGFGHQQQSTSLDNEFSTSMLQNQTQNEQKQPLISFKYHPGFFCFFQAYVDNQGWTFFDCYKKVFNSHHELAKVIRPTESIINDKNLGRTQKLQELANRSDKSKVFAYYQKNEDESIICQIAEFENQRIEHIEKLKKQLEKLERIKQKVINDKKKQFQEKETEKVKQQQLEIEGILNEKQRRANLVRRVLMQAEQRRLQKQYKKGLSQNSSFSSSLMQKAGLNECTIM